LVSISGKRFFTSGRHDTNTESITCPRRQHGLRGHSPFELFV